MGGRWIQWEWLAWTGPAGFFFGLMISSMFACVLPFGWDAQIAAFIMQADRWYAGQALMKTADPAGRATLAAEVNLLEPNRAALTACREA
jgi:hypothetical protein